MALDIEASYSLRAPEYIALLGSIATAHPSDIQLVSSWSTEVEGLLLDAGCGPGHWTSYLARSGSYTRGIDLVPAFIEHARTAHPGVEFEVGSIDALPNPPESIGGVLAWYSLIHHEPARIRQPLAEFARVLRPGGKLLVGFFTGLCVEPFDHSIATAYRWPPEALAAELREAGFEVCETHTRIGSNPKPRPHGAILAQLSGDR